METDPFSGHMSTLIVLFTVLAGAVFWAILAIGNRAGGAGGGAAKFGLTSAVVLAAWFGVAFVAAASGITGVGYAPIGVPNLAIALVAAVIVGWVALYQPAFRRAVDGVPLAWFTGYHTLRATFGVFFLTFLEMGRLPEAFALRGGYGDIGAGILGGLAAFLILLGASAGVTRAAVWVFSVVGLLDFAVVLYTGLTTLVPDAPYASFYQFVLIPTYVVPLFFLTHIFALRALLRQARG